VESLGSFLLGLEAAALVGGVADGAFNYSERAGGAAEDHEGDAGCGLGGRVGGQ
jgi:hypothetical protein